MTEPTIELIPSRPAVRSDGPTTLDVLVRITPPTPEVHFVRPPINLGLVLDRSGSMQGAKKMEYAIDAACFAVEQLLPTDRVSVTIFDSEVETIAPNAPATDKAGLIGRLRQVTPRGATALHAGWKEGADQVESGRRAEGLDRVILLSDGLANQGVTDPEAISGEVRGLASRGVSTTTMGLGDDYNEDLMQAMGQAGDGNYYYIESPVQLVDIFQTELNGLMANLGRKVALGLEPGHGARVAEVLNELGRDAGGGLILSNLVLGMPLTVVVRLAVDLFRDEAETCRFRLEWDAPEGGARRSASASLALPAVPSAEWEAMAVDPGVAEQVALLMAARAKKEAVAAYDRGDLDCTLAGVAFAARVMREMPMSPTVARELGEIDQLQADLAANQGAKFRKRSAFQTFQRDRGQDK